MATTLPATPEMTSDHMSKRIRERRLELGLTRPQLAERICALGHKTREQQIYRWERDTEPLPRAKQFIERALELPPGALSNHDYVPSIVGLTPAGILGECESMRLTPGERATLQKHLVSVEASHEVVTHDYVHGFISGLRSTGSAAEAYAHAVTEQATREMEAEGRHPVAPATPVRLLPLGNGVADPGHGKRRQPRKSADSGPAKRNTPPRRKRGKGRVPVKHRA